MASSPLNARTEKSHSVENKQMSWELFAHLLVFGFSTMGLSFGSGDFLGFNFGSGDLLGF